jgi:LacI family transcriptional regulator
VKRLHYQPHASAQRLASKKTNTVSAIIPFFTNYFFVQVLQGVQDKAFELGIDLILYGVNHPEQAEFYLKRSMNRGHVDGVMFFSMKLPDSYVARFQQMVLPLVMVDAVHPKFDSIKVENREGALLAVRHLVSLGHKEIAMINASLKTQPARDRMDGYRAALEEADIPFSMDRVFVSSIGRQDGFNRDAGRASMRELIRSRSGGGPITAVFVASDVQAIGVLEVARELSISIPSDLAVVGFDDIELAQHMGLTTMRQPMYDMGELAMERLSARMRDPQAPATITSFMPELVVRESCGAHAHKTGELRP